MIQDICPDVLVVETESDATRLMLECLACRGARATVSRSAGDAADRIDARPWDLVLCNLGMPGGGLDLVRRIRLSQPDLPVVGLMADGTVRAAVEAMREGCADLLTKPLGREAVGAMLQALLPARSVPLAAADEADGRCLYRIAGRSPRLHETIALAKKAAPTSMPVLITGESGTGKELLSYLVHRASRRAQGPYIRVNCAALSDTLLESELFGHERGAFTGAIAQRKGRFERAHGGTLLLDEISETGPRLQAELLRVLEQQDFERVGGSQAVSVNVRVISTSNRDVAREVHAGRFRTDLYWRLCGLHIAVPPLRDRKEDIPVLVWHFVNQFAREVRRPITGLDPEMMDLLLRYDWPGNVRQLRNVVRTALIVGDGPVLSLAGAPWMIAELSSGAARPACPTPPAGGQAAGGAETGLRLRDLERQAILQALRLTRSHQARAAGLLGITDRTLREKLRRYRREGFLPAEDACGGRRRTGPGAPADKAPCAPPADEPAPAQGEEPCLIAQA
ncbi:MAG: sigma-54-dependent Fis family transcriptional regulator [Planctomycetes bacterium]|nr:sigma-54-dependent Fis family transcriptional regulator [Planctomycetota bacterium]